MSHVLVVSADVGESHAVMARALVSGGGWGVGGIDGLCHTLQSHHGYDHRVSVLGYSTQMRGLLCGADAFVTTTAASSIQEARVCGVPTVYYGFLIAHVRDNVNALAEQGIARTATRPNELTEALSGALREGPAPDASSRPLARAGGS